nr:MFS transporter [Methanobacterium formicicum]
MSENTNEIIENKRGLGSSTIFVMIVLALGVFMTAMDAYIFVPALPTIIADLQTSLNWATWTLTTYMLFMTAIMALAGKLSDVFGRKKIVYHWCDHLRHRINYRQLILGHIFLNSFHGFTGYRCWYCSAFGIIQYE